MGCTSFPLRGRGEGIRGEGEDLGTLGHWDIGEGEKIQWLSLAICGRAGWGPPAHLILLTDASHRFRICISFSDE